MANANSRMTMRPLISVDINKWPGEDEPEDVKDCWDDENDEESGKTPKINAAACTKSIKSKKAELCHVQDEKNERYDKVTAEEKLVEKLRLEEVQKEMDLKAAIDTFGLSSNDLNNFNPKSVEDFKELRELLERKLSLYKESSYYANFIQDLIYNICNSLSIAVVKKIKISLDKLHSEKVKLEKDNTKKVAHKTKGKSLKRYNKNAFDDYLNYDLDYNDSDYDLM